MKKTIGLLVGCISLAAFAGGHGKAVVKSETQKKVVAVAGDTKAKPAAKTEAKPVAAAATDGGTATPEAKPAPAPAKK